MGPFLPGLLKSGKCHYISEYPGMSAQVDPTVPRGPGGHVAQVPEFCWGRIRGLFIVCTGVASQGSSSGDPSSPPFSQFSVAVLVSSWWFCPCWTRQAAHLLVIIPPTGSAVAYEPLPEIATGRHGLVALWPSWSLW